MTLACSICRAPDLQPPWSMVSVFIETGKLVMVTGTPHFQTMQISECTAWKYRRLAKPVCDKAAKQFSGNSACSKPLQSETEILLYKNDRDPTRLRFPIDNQNLVDAAW